MTTVVRNHYPAERLPDDLREGIDLGKRVTVMVVEEERPEHVMSLDEIFASREPPFLTREQVDRYIRELREDR